MLDFVGNFVGNPNSTASKMLENARICWKMLGNVGYNTENHEIYPNP